MRPVQNVAYALLAVQSESKFADTVAVRAQINRQHLGERQVKCERQ